MKNVQSILNSLNERFFSSTYQIKRLIIIMIVIIVLLAVSFGGYYYYDRFYQAQTPVTEQSVSKAEALVRSDPQNVDKRIMLAEVYLLTRRFDDSITQANQVLTANKSDATNQRAWLVLGVAYASTQRPGNAIDPLTKYYLARKDEANPGLDRTLVSAAYYLGDSYLQLNQPDKAIDPLVHAVAWSKTDADAMYKLGLAFKGIKDYASAIDMFTRATVFVPDYTEAYQAMAECYDVTQQPDLANYARGMVAFSKKDFTTAQGLILKATLARLDFAPAFAGLGMTDENLKDYQNAKSAYETALMLDPQNFAATNGLQRVNMIIGK